MSITEAKSEKCHQQYLADILKRGDAWQSVFLRDKHLIKYYITVLNHPETNFVLNLCSFQTRSSFPHNKPRSNQM
jgi:hypothetical protein